MPGLPESAGQVPAPGGAHVSSEFGQGVLLDPEDALRAELDPGIRRTVCYLRDHEIDTFESCQGGEGHSWPHPCVHFQGDENAGLWVVWLLEHAGTHVRWLSRTWDLDHGLPRSPYWEVVL